MAALVGGGSPELVMPLRHLTGKEIAVFGSSAYAPSQFEEIAEFVRRHGVKLASVVSEFYPLEEGVEAFRVAADANTGKVMFRLD
jgi:threonine dehydrogenase-like Zn-dependent dehydrogenase